MIIRLRQDECFTGRSGRGGLELITSVISGARTLERLQKEA